MLYIKRIRKHYYKAQSLKKESKIICSANCTVMVWKLQIQLQPFQESTAKAFNLVKYFISRLLIS